MLSREWEHWGEPRWLTSFNKLKDSFARHVLVAPRDEGEQALRIWIARKRLAEPYPLSPEAEATLEAATEDLVKKMNELQGGKKDLVAARPLLEAAVDRLLLNLARGAQKPDFGIPRQSLETEARERWFPAEHCWSGAWYLGPGAVAGTASQD
jgi:hypothetical protein